MNKIQYKNNKSLKLTNVLKRTMIMDDDSFNLNLLIEQMQSYIKFKGGVQIGPLIQYTKPYINDKNELDIEVIMMLQCNNYFHSVEQSYKMDSIVRIPNCLYCRYNGPEDKIKLAYDKINIEAFENDIELEGDSYTIFINKNEEDDTIVADIFMPKV